MPAHAAPTGGQVAAGSGAVSQAAGNTIVNQTSQNLSLNWQSFNVGAHESVNFVQPNAAAIAVNRIADTSASQILGSLNANGQVFLINPNGIVFGAGAQVNVGGLVASTLNISDSDLASAVRHFSGSGAGAVVNHGTIAAASGGYVALLGRQVSNQGTISAPGGTAALGAGSAVSLSFDASRLLSMQVDANELNALAENKQLIVADGGQVLMSAGAKDSLLASVVNNTGVIQAQTVANHNGRIVLLAGMAAGTTTVNGTLDASAPDGGDGGFIETSGAHVQVADAARISTLAAGGKTGTWLIDPHDYTVAASGGDISGSALSNSLNGSNVEVKTSAGANTGSGDLNVNDVISWNANTTLKLKASNNININASITATGDMAGLVISPNTTNTNGVQEVASGTGVYSLNNGASITLSGAAPRLKIGGTEYTVINALGVAGSQTGTDLQGINGGLAGHYALGSDIDASATSAWNGGAGFTPIGNGVTSFSGVFDGLGHTISGLTINDTAGINDQGLFGDTDYSSIIRNVGLLGGSLTSPGGSNGSLVGMNKGLISHAFATGTVGGAGSLGGLVGLNDSAGTISQSYATGAVSGDGTLGGLVGYSTGTISQSYAMGAVSGGGDWGLIGGLAGFNYGVIKQSYATGSVSGSDGTRAVGGLVGANSLSVNASYATGAVTSGENAFVGGLVGDNEGSIKQSYAIGAVSGGDSALVGGLVGDNYAGTINQTYATGAVTGGDSASVGGLVGTNESRSKVIQSYATGAVSGGASAALGGLIGRNSGGSTITTSYWNTETSGRNTSAGTGATGLTTAQTMTATSFAGWDLATAGGSNAVWRIYEGDTAPLLRAFMTNVTIAANDVTTTYTGAVYAGSSVYTVGTLSPTFWLASTSVDTGLLAGNVNTNTPAVNAGGYLLNRGPYSGQMGYDIAFTAGNMTINPAPLQYVANDATRPYGAADPAFTGSVTGLVGGDTLAGVATGTLLWTTPAYTTIPGGSYPIFGSGLSVINPNYSGLGQAPGNLTALTVQAQAPPIWVFPIGDLPIGGFPIEGLPNDASMAVAGLTQGFDRRGSGQSATDDMQFALSGQSDPDAPKLFTVVGSGMRLP